MPYVSLPDLLAVADQDSLIRYEDAVRRLPDVFAGRAPCPKSNPPRPDFNLQRWKVVKLVYESGRWMQGRSNFERQDQPHQGKRQNRQRVKQMESFFHG